MRIRLAREADLGAAAQLWFDRLALLQQSNARYRPLPDAVNRWRSAAKGWIASDQCAFFVAAEADALLGFIVVGAADGPAGREPERIGILLEMAVDLHQSHRGMSRSLLASAEAWLRTKDIDTLAVDAPSAYPVEAAFWHGQGAKPHSTTYWLAI